MFHSWVCKMHVIKRIFFPFTYFRVDGKNSIFTFSKTRKDGKERKRDVTSRGNEERKKLQFYLRISEDNPQVPFRGFSNTGGHDTVYSILQLFIPVCS